MMPSSQTPYMRDLLDQPRALRETLAGLRAQSLPNAIVRWLGRGDLNQLPFQNIVLTGMGSSLHAFHPLHQALVRRRCQAQMIEAAELLYSLDALLRPETLVIAASQSGYSAEIVSLIERKAAGFALLGITNTADSPLATRSDAIVLTRAGEEAAVSCKTYLATLTALAWLEPGLFGEWSGGALNEIESVVPAIEAYLNGWEAHVARLMDLLRDTREVFVVGRGRSLAAAGTGGLITKESTHLHGEGMSSAAFRHGPFEMLSREVFVLVFEGYGPTAALNRRLYEDILKAGGTAGLVSEQSEEAVYRLPHLPEVARPLFEILPVEMMTLALAGLHGHEAGKFSLGTKITDTE